MVLTTPDIFNSPFIGDTPFEMKKAAGTLLLNVTTTGTPSTIDITGIPTEYARLKFLFDGTFSAGGNMTFLFNNDTGANYSYSLQLLVGSVESYASTETGTNAFLGETGNSHSIIEMDIYNASAAKPKGWFSRIASAGGARFMLSGGIWNNTSSKINRVSIAVSAGSITAGSVYTLVGFEV